VGAARKLCLIMVDAMRADMLRAAVEQGKAPHFAALLERGSERECVSAFPSVTPVCCAEIATGVAADRHWISGMNWYHRVEQRYVEYGSSFEATRAFGLFRSTYDVVYNLNMGHLSPEVETVFESLADAGLRSACTPFLIFRGRTRHDLGLDGLLRAGALAAGFKHAAWGPEEFFYGELFSSRPVDCKATLARPGTRDEYSACAAAELAGEPDSYDFILLSLPDNDFHAHRFGPDAMVGSLAHADRCFGRFVEAAGGIDAFLERHAVILMADHAQTEVEREVSFGEELASRWEVLGPSWERPELAELAVSPTSRAANLYVLPQAPDRERLHAELRDELASHEACELVAWLERPDGTPCLREGAGSPVYEEPAARAVVRRADGELRFRHAGGGEGDEPTGYDLRGAGWRLDGDPAVLGLPAAGRELASAEYPDGLARLWSALTAPHAGDVVVSLAPGWECVDWGGTSHQGGGSHGSLRAEDSLVPLVLCGLEPEAEPRQWRLTDVAGLVRSHFGLAPDAAAAGERAGTGART
jgi:hypothetical protein